MKAFISYSHRDSDALERLHVHLAMLRRDGLIQEWFDREILAGREFDQEIKSELEESDLFLLLVSPDFLNSDYCYNTEMQRALERNQEGSAVVVPIIVEPCEWKASALRALKALPKDGKPVSEWTNPNNAYLDIAQELRRLLKSDVSDAASVPQSLRARESERIMATRRYRVKRDFDEIDRADFRKSSFDEVRSYFASAVAELDGIEDIKARFYALSETSFGATIVNRVKNSRAAHITVHLGSERHSLNDIYYSFSERAPRDTSNGGFSVDADEFELFLTDRSFNFGREKSERLTSEAAAEQLWSDFLEQAGVVYD